MYIYTITSNTSTKKKKTKQGWLGEFIISRRQNRFAMCRRYRNVLPLYFGSLLFFFFCNITNRMNPPFQSYCIPLRGIEWCIYYKDCREYIKVSWLMVAKEGRHFVVVHADFMRFFYLYATLLIFYVILCVPFKETIPRG